MTGHKEIIIAAGPIEQAHKGAQIFCQTAKICAESQARFAVAISGGATPRAMHRLLSKEPYRSAIPWGSTHIFWVDDRMVPFNHPNSNFGAAQKDFLDHVPIPLDHLHPMPVEMAPEEGAIRYQEELRAFFKLVNEGIPVFDLIFLGIGTDGHIASLFPGQSFKEASQKLVGCVKGGNPDVYRLTLTYQVLNKAKDILFLVSGKKKAPILQTIFKDASAGLPAQKIQTWHRQLTWLLDHDAASQLNSLIRNEV